MVDGDTPSPLVQRRRLRVELRRAREQAGLTQEDVAKAMAWSPSKVIRIESGQSKITQNDLKVLMGHLGIVDSERVHELLQLARGARAKSWWSKYKNVASPGLLEFVELEAAAAATRNFEMLLVPGLLQTEEYAREVIPRFKASSSREEIDQLVELRMTRQKLLDRSDSPQLFFVLDEGVLRRLVGSEALMGRQIRHLAAVAERPNVTINVLPYGAGVHAGMHGPFVVIEFPEPDEAVLYLENPHGDIVQRSAPDDIRAWQQDFADLQARSLGPQGSAAYLGKIADELA